MSSQDIICLEQADFRSPLWEQTIFLRDEVLRRPLGLRFSEADLEGESTDLHCTAVDRSGRLLACLVLTPLNGVEIRMRQVAVDPAYQRSGLGRVLVAWSEELAGRLGFRKMVLHARDTAVPFYLRLGYRIEGEEFTEVSIPHRYMSREL